MLRGIRRFAIIGAGLLAMGAATMPASAQGGAAGAVTGTVNLSPGFATPPPAGLDNQTFQFNSIVLTGVGASVQCAGVLTANASAAGGSIAEVVAGGVGTLSINAGATCTVGATTIAASGVYVRVGVLVAVAATTSAPGPGAVVVPVSVFLPNQTPPATIASATFAGVWALAFA